MRLKSYRYQLMYLALSRKTAYRYVFLTLLPKIQLHNTPGGKVGGFCISVLGHFMFNCTDSDIEPT
jgi:hypothetical protein